MKFSIGSNRRPAVLPIERDGLMILKIDGVSVRTNGSPVVETGLVLAGFPSLGGLKVIRNEKYSGNLTLKRAAARLYGLAYATIIDERPRPPLSYQVSFSKVE